jgi:glyoxylase-like metal-dependent hydrolase (beta-lactamase superfamily II)
MVNFVYLVGDTDSKEAWLVDPAWNIDDLVNRVEESGFKLTGALYTHWHPDHAGGDLYGTIVQGAAVIHDQFGVPVLCHQADAPWLARIGGIAIDKITTFVADEVLELGAIRARCVHTPGHTPGSTCYLVSHMGGAESRPASLLTGDTLFVEACGRVDLPGSDPEEMYRTLNQRLVALPAETIVYPGHNYGPRPVSTLADEQRTNPYMNVPTLEAWLGKMG